MGSLGAKQIFIAHHFSRRCRAVKEMQRSGSWMIAQNIGSKGRDGSIFENRGALEQGRNGKNPVKNSMITGIQRAERGRGFSNRGEKGYC